MTPKKNTPTPKAAAKKPTVKAKAKLKPKAKTGTPRKPTKAPAAKTRKKSEDGVVKWPYEKLVDPTPPDFPVFGDPDKFMDPFTKDEFKALEEAIDTEEIKVGNFVTEARKTPVGVLEVISDVQKRLAGTTPGDALQGLHRTAFLPNIERWEIPDPDPAAKKFGNNTPTFVRFYTPPPDQIHHLWAPDNHRDTVWTHTWRGMLPDGPFTCVGGRLPVGNQRAGLAGAMVYASAVRELCHAPPPGKAKRSRKNSPADASGEVAIVVDVGTEAIAMMHRLTLNHMARQVATLGGGLGG